MGKEYRASLVLDNLPATSSDLESAEGGRVDRGVELGFSLPADSDADAFGVLGDGRQYFVNNHIIFNVSAPTSPTPISPRLARPDLPLV